MINRKENEPGITKGILLGVLLTFALILIGCTPSGGQGKTNAPISPIPRPTTAMSANTPDARPQPQRLRVTNQGAIILYNLVVIFPDERIVFGDVPAGATTGYQVFSHGVYSYAAYNVEVEGREYMQPVVDWIGEAPRHGEAFTYILEADPTRWETEGQVIRLVKVVEDLAP